uniref:Uncharacterized protein n=1 Tax=Homo sapiens TaxID=9606 RepID=Q99809_HUMAN|nr:hypothetical protein A4 [Homo sapiens]
MAWWECPCCICMKPLLFRPHSHQNPACPPATPPQQCHSHLPQRSYSAKPSQGLFLWTRASLVIICCRVSSFTVC